MAKHQPGTSPCILQELEDAKTTPAFFTCTSGELLWGQVHTVISGFSDSTRLDKELGPQQESDGGTDLESSARFKVIARKGQWKVEAAFLDNDEGDPWHIGFVCHHVDVDGEEVLRRAAEAGLGGDGKFADLDIVVVGRYDWSGSWSPGCEIIVEAVEGKVVDPDEEEFEDEQYFRSLVQGRFMLVDAQGFPNLMQALKDGTRIEKRNYVMRKKVNPTGSSSADSSDTKSLDLSEKSSSNCEDVVFGTHLVVDHSEYDMGWMAFQNGQLVGFVYDGAYSALEGDNLRLGKKLVIKS
ncbi:hypothetical protein KC19_2G027300 [Ceratodon purpureus]|uniref:Uncharacterized protein n=1 Tax=Ceratodon purpureus TaxID=3225 RepID=A0A8T0IS73_CERPU|nr:hypothetical protein KC19_2G027300 [Ceratodon purpureus]